jgi:hypothetical protein
MKTLTPEQCPRWLKDAGFNHDPFRGSGEASYHFMTGGLTDSRRSIAFARNLLQAIQPNSDHLLEITDWSLYQKDEMAVVQSLRASFGETRWLIKSPGHVFPPSDLDLGVGLFALTIAYGWSSYIYIPTPRLTIFNWEGDMFEFWSDEKKSIELAEEFSRSHELPKHENA